MAYVSASNQLFIVDEQSNQLTRFNVVDHTYASISVGINPHSVTRNANNGMLYVVNNGSNTISVVDPQAFKVVGTIATCTGGLNDISTYLATNVVYYSCAGGNMINAFDANTYQVISSIKLPTGVDPGGVGIIQATGMAYIPNQAGNTLTVLDLKNSRVAGSQIVVGSFPFGIAQLRASLTTAPKTLYVANANGNTLSILDTATNTVTGSITVGSGPRVLTVVATTGLGYVANFNSNTVSVFDTATNTVVGSPIPVGVNPQGVNYDADHHSIYITNVASNSISVITLPSS